MDNFKFTRSMMINIACTGARQMNIGNQSIIEGKKVLAIVTNLNIGPNSKTSNGVEPCRLQDGAFIKLVNAKNEVIHEAVHLGLLDPGYTAGARVFQLDTTGVDWTKSSVFFGNPQDGIDSAGKEIPLMVVYE